jgi:SAM-dependent methyltransferase
VLGIPDFRVFPDPWIGLDDDREKARRLEERSRGASLEAMVRAYWAMTPGTPTHHAARFVQHVMTAHERSREWLDRLDEASPSPPGGWLDVGTGTGDLACAVAAQGIQAVGVDIAMRWLVVARRRAELSGVAVDLVCCNAEHLPFADATFARVVSVGALEHCVSANRALSEARRVLVRGGVRLRTVNRFTMLAEPHVGIWGVGSSHVGWPIGSFVGAAAMATRTTVRFHRASSTRIDPRRLHIGARRSRIVAGDRAVSLGRFAVGRRRV